MHVLGRLQTQTWPGPLRYLGSMRRHGRVDPGERLGALGKSASKACDAWIKATHPGVVHDHRPDHDAEYAYYQMIYLNTVAVVSV